MRKVAFDPGHHAGANAGPGNYLEGDAMLRLGQELQKAYGVFLTRTDGKDVDLYERCRRAKNAGCDTMISLHTNAPEAAKGVLVIYSLQRPNDKVIAENIGKELAAATDLRFRAAITRQLSESKPDTDYYGILRHSVELGIVHSFIVEHGSHWEFAQDTQTKTEAIVEAYGRILGVIKEMDWLDVIKKVTDSPDKWEAAIKTAVNVANAEGDLGSLEILKFLPDLIMKIYNSPRE